MTRFSVAIPAWNSSAYLEDAILSLLAMDDESLEIVVSVDPGPDDAPRSRDIVRGFRDRRLRLVEPDEPLSMAEHYEWCAGQLTGDFGTIIGADDGALPWCTAVARRLVERHPEADALMFRRAYYFWPGVEDEYGSAAVILDGSPRITVPSGPALIRRALQGRVEHYDLPQFYTNNFIRLDLAARVRTRDGVLFAETNPDVYSGIVLARSANHLVRCETPVFWTGTSPNSLGVAQRRAVVTGDTAAVNTVRDEFLGRSRTSGRGVAPVVGERLWLHAQDTPVYVLSAHLRSLEARRVSPRSFRVRWDVATALAAVELRLALPSMTEPGRWDALAEDIARARVEAGVPRWMIAVVRRVVQALRGYDTRIAAIAKHLGKRMKRLRRLLKSPVGSTVRLKLERDAGVERLRHANRFAAELAWHDLASRLR